MNVTDRLMYEAWRRSGSINWLHILQTDAVVDLNYGLWASCGPEEFEFGHSDLINSEKCINIMILMSIYFTSFLIDSLERKKTTKKTCGLQPLQD